MLQALIFDVDGTLADTESAHLKAFNLAFQEQGLEWVWDVDTYKRLLEVSGGKERILFYWTHQVPDLTDLDGLSVRSVVDQIHESKSAFYESLMEAGEVEMRPGVLRLLYEAKKQDIKLAIATTTSNANVRALLVKHLGADALSIFSVIEDASTAPNKKPHPQAYTQALQRLGLTPKSCLAFEDSHNGLVAATKARLQTVITPNVFTQHHDFSGAWLLSKDLSEVRLNFIQARFNGHTVTAH
jgi:HAD superfamily hydrolase (TIGR01509 family)